MFEDGDVVRNRYDFKVLGIIVIERTPFYFFKVRYVGRIFRASHSYISYENELLLREHWRKI
jgi:hypothetical protein